MSTVTEPDQDQQQDQAPPPPKPADLVRRTEDGAASLAVRSDQAWWTRGQQAALASIGLADCPDPDKAAFLHLCQTTGLDPFRKEVYLIGRRDSKMPSGKKWTPQTGIDGFRHIAERTGKFAGVVSREWCGEDGVWVDVWLKKGVFPSAARVGIKRTDQEHLTYGIAVWDEYVPMEDEWKNNSKTGEKVPGKMWQKMPSHMLVKCAEALAIRTAFPRELASVYSPEEMQRADVEHRQAEQRDMAQERSRVREENASRSWSRGGVVLGADVSRDGDDSVVIVDQQGRVLSTDDPDVPHPGAPIEDAVVVEEPDRAALLAELDAQAAAHNMTRAAFCARWVRSRRKNPEDATDQELLDLVASRREQTAEAVAMKAKHQAERTPDEVEQGDTTLPPVVPPSVNPDTEHRYVEGDHGDCATCGSDYFDLRHGDHGPPEEPPANDTSDLLGPGPVIGTLSDVAVVNDLSGTVARNDLHAALRFVSQAVPNRPPMQVLLGVLLDASKGDGLRVRAFDYEVAAEDLVLAPGMRGRALVPARTLAAIVSVLPAGCSLVLSMEGPDLKIVGPNQVFVVPGMQIGDYPAFPDATDGVPFSITGADLTLAARCCKAAGRDDTLPVLTGVKFGRHIGTGFMEVAATDRYRLAHVVSKTEWPEDVSMLVPARTLGWLAAAFAKEDVVTVTPSTAVRNAQIADSVHFKAGLRTVYTRLLEGEFPKYHTLLPADDTCKWSLDLPRLPFIQAAKEARVVLERNTPLRFTYDAATSTLTVAGGGEGYGNSRASVTLADVRLIKDDPDEGVKVAYNDLFLLDGLTAFPKAERVIALAGGNTRPVIFRDPATPGFQYLLMPVRLSG